MNHILMNVLIGMTVLGGCKLKPASNSKPLDAWNNAVTARTCQPGMTTVSSNQPTRVYHWTTAKLQKPTLAETQSATQAFIEKVIVDRTAENIYRTSGYLAAGGLYVAGDPLQSSYYGDTLISINVKAGVVAGVVSPWKNGVVNKEQTHKAFDLNCPGGHYRFGFDFFTSNHAMAFYDATALDYSSTEVLTLPHARQGLKHLTAFPYGSDSNLNLFLTHMGYRGRCLGTLLDDLKLEKVSDLELTKAGLACEIYTLVPNNHALARGIGRSINPDVLYKELKADFKDTSLSLSQWIYIWRSLELLPAQQNPQDFHALATAVYTEFFNSPGGARMKEIVSALKGLKVQYQSAHKLDDWLRSDNGRPIGKNAIF